MPENPELLRAVIAAPDDDLPRLVYADWLDEHGDPDLAEFIRVQCRLAATTPADPDWIDLRDRESELLCRLHPRLRELEPPNTDRRFYFGHGSLRHRDGNLSLLRRGFPYSLSDQTQTHEYTPSYVRKLISDLEQVVKDTTVRAFHQWSSPIDNLEKLLAAPIMGQFRALELTPEIRIGDGYESYPAAVSAAVAALTDGPVAGRLQALDLCAELTTEAVARLARSGALPSLEHLELRGLGLPEVGFERLGQADWFGQLRTLNIRNRPRDPAAFVGTAGDLPILQTFRARLEPDDIRHLAAGKFPALARLTLPGPKDPAVCCLLEGSQFPALTELRLKNDGMRSEAWAALLRAEWFSRLRVLRMSQVMIGDKAIVAMAEHPVARVLRTLTIKGSALGKTGLAAMAKPDAFPQLTTLDLEAMIHQKPTVPGIVAFLSRWASPRLRHLRLGHWPVGDVGAIALASNPAFAGLTRLCLDDSGIGPAGAAALFASPYLQNLVELNLHFNTIGQSANALADPGVMPRLGKCWLNSSLPGPIQARINAVRAVRHVMYF